MCHTTRDKVEQLRESHGFTIARIVDWYGVLDGEAEEYTRNKTPWHFGIEIRHAQPDNKKSGLITFYLAYSSWTGRILYVDQLRCHGLEDHVEKLVLQILADIALDLDCARLTWRHTQTPEWHKEGSNQPEYHSEVLTLSMTQDAMVKFISDGPLADIRPTSGRFSHDLVKGAFSQCLDLINAHQESGFRLRLAQEDDLETIELMVKGLAEYVNEPDAIEIGSSDYRKDGFDLEDPLWYCLLIDRVHENGSMETCGYAFVFVGYLLGSGRFVYLEDLFLKVEQRGGGGGKMTMKTLAALCLSLECNRLYWQALDWNASGLKFYESIGATIHHGEKTSRYAGEALRRFAEKGTI